ncbi:hypothetical protein [Flammeovirga pectinis]|uniref:hypothetical protein n=1 Tax=Flammeovirga pectinis TaxID=2494373 RepID=UPI00197AA6FA|nr:hypothetical protein [Flammeovirga pectinis]
MNKWIYTAISTLFTVTSVFAQEFDDMYFTKADREALSAKPAMQPLNIGNHDFPDSPDRQAPQSRFANPDGVGTGYGYQYYNVENGAIPSSIPSTGSAYMDATQGMSIAEQQSGKSSSGGFFSNPSVSLGMSAGTYGTSTSVGIGFGNNSAFSLGIGFGMGMGMGGMYPGYGMGGMYPGYGMGGMYPGYGRYPGYGYGGGMYDPMYGGYPGYGYRGYPGYGYYPTIRSRTPTSEQVARAQSVRSRVTNAPAAGVKYPSRYRESSVARTATAPRTTTTRPSNNNWNNSRNSFNNNSLQRPSSTSGSSFRSAPSGAGRSSGSAGRSVRRR